MLDQVHSAANSERKVFLSQPKSASGALTAAVIGERLSLQAFHQLSGVMGGYPFVKVVVERATQRIHFINNSQYSFHADYIAEVILGQPREVIRKSIDEFNRQVYLAPDRQFYLGILSYHLRGPESFFALETVEIDNMNQAMLRQFYGVVSRNLDQAAPLFFKPANHEQESIVAEIPTVDLPRIYNHELFASSDFVALNGGEARGRLRVFDSLADFRQQASTLEWYDIIVMRRVPDEIPRVAGLINAEHTTPLSHTNVLACGWQIPNAVQLGAIEDIRQRELDRRWVIYRVDAKAGRLQLDPMEPTPEDFARPAWSIQRIRLEEPATTNVLVAPLEDLRISDRCKYGTKAANLGELRHVLQHGSQRLLGFYRIPRPPRANLLCYLREYFAVPEGGDLQAAACQFIESRLIIPRGIAIPFALQQEFLEASPRIQQAIGKLKMALVLNASEVDSLCVELQTLIRQTRVPDRIRDAIDEQMAMHLSGISSFVVRSSSNAEDLPNFSAAGIYESINHVTTAEKIFDSIKEVWSSLVSPRSVRLRHQVGISLDDSYMGVIVQEEVTADMGGVMVTTNPMNQTHDFRNVYINASTRSVNAVVDGSDLPYQYLYNTVEGGGRTISLGSQKQDLDKPQKRVLQDLAIAGRLLQSHFAQDYTFSTPADIEWAARGNDIYLLQLRPYAL